MTESLSVPLKSDAKVGTFFEFSKFYQIFLTLFFHTRHVTQFVFHYLSTLYIKSYHLSKIAEIILYQAMEIINGTINGIHPILQYYWQADFLHVSVRKLKTDSAVSSQIARHSTIRNYNLIFQLFFIPIGDREYFSSHSLVFSGSP